MSCSCEMQIFEGVKEQVVFKLFIIFNLFVLRLSPVSSFLLFPIKNHADQKFFENSFFLFSHLLSR